MKKHKLPTWSLSGNIKWDHSKCLKSYTAVKGNPSNLNSEYCDLCCDSISWCGADRSIRYSKHALSCTQSYECTLVLYIYFVWSVHVAVISAHTDNWNTFCTQNKKRRRRAVMIWWSLRRVQICSASLTQCKADVKYSVTGNLSKRATM